MIIDRVQHPGWLVNSWLVAGRQDGRALLIDTGAEAAKVLEMVRRHSARVQAIVCTHRHYDHIAGNEFIARNLGVPVFAHKLERAFVPGVTEVVEDGQRFQVGRWEAEFLHIPGHTAGQLGVHVPGVGVWTGDTLFKGSVGGTMGSGATGFGDLRASVERLLQLPEDLKVYPGHGEPSQVGTEKERNPFVRMWDGRDQAGTRPARVEGKRVTIEVWGTDYDGGHKAQVRFNNSRVEIVGGSKVQKVTL
jgi:glyoxylase-like metal-dependent hydrolase (beta-lactamase superfamily II)